MIGFESASRSVALKRRFNQIQLGNVHRRCMPTKSNVHGQVWYRRYSTLSQRCTACPSAVTQSERRTNLRKRNLCSASDSIKVLRIEYSLWDGVGAEKPQPKNQLYEKFCDFLVQVKCFLANGVRTHIDLVRWSDFVLVENWKMELMKTSKAVPFTAMRPNAS